MTLATLRKTALTLAVTAGMAASAGIANAATYNLGTITDDSFNGFSQKFNAGTTFTDYWNFSLSGGVNDLAALIGSVFTKSTGFINSFTATLTGPGSFSAPITITSDGSAQSGSFGGSLASGDYTLTISGRTLNKAASYSVGITAAVPEPGEWAMMLAGLGLVGLVARRRSRSV